MAPTSDVPVFLHLTLLFFKAMTNFVSAKLRQESQNFPSQSLIQQNFRIAKQNRPMPSNVTATVAFKNIATPLLKVANFK